MRQALNFFKFEKLWNEGKSYEAIGKALGMKGKDKADPYKPVRATASRLLNHNDGGGWADPATGKRHYLKPRAGMRNIGVGKSVAGSAKKTTGHRSPKKAVGKGRKATKTTVKKSTGKAVVIGMHQSGLYLRVEVGGQKALLDASKGNALMIDALHQQGFDVVAKPKVEVPNGPVESLPDAAVAKIENATKDQAPATPENTVTGTEGPADGPLKDVIPVPQTSTQTTEKDVAA